MIARRCSCEKPMVFSDDPENCVRCGRWAIPEKISASTWNLALAIGSYALGLKRQPPPGKKPTHQP